MTRLFARTSWQFFGFDLDSSVFDMELIVKLASYQMQEHGVIGGFANNQMSRQC